MEQLASSPTTSPKKDGIIYSAGSNNYANLSFEDLKYYEPDSIPTAATGQAQPVELGGPIINVTESQVEAGNNENNVLLEGSNDPQPSTSKETAKNGDDDQRKRKRARKDSGSSWSMEIIDDVDTDDTDSENWNFTDEEEIERQAEIERKVSLKLKREMEIFKARLRARGIAGLDECTEQNSENPQPSTSTSHSRASVPEQQQQNEVQPPASPDYVPVSQVEAFRATASFWDNQLGLEAPDLGPLDSEEEVYYNEFEVASVSDINENPIEDANSSSNGEEEPSGELDPLNTTFISKDDLELEDNFADGERHQSDSEAERANSNNTTSQSSNKLCSTDSELSDRDKWTCSQCYAKCLPFFRYCVRCFRIRRNWLPKRPRSRRLKQKNSLRLALNRVNSDSSHQTTVDQVDNRDLVDEKLQSETSAVSNTSRQFPSTSRINLNEGFLVCEDKAASDRLDSNSFPGDETHSELLTPPTSQEDKPEYELKLQLPLITPQLITENSTQNVDDLRTATEKNPAEETLKRNDFNPEKDPTEETLKRNTKESNICSLCCTREKDAAFVHNKIAHHFCCFSCADKILKKDGKCPICRDRVLRVVKIISA